MDDAKQPLLSEIRVSYSSEKTMLRSPVIDRNSQLLGVQFDSILPASFQHRLQFLVVLITIAAPDQEIIHDHFSSVSKLVRHHLLESLRSIHASKRFNVVYITFYILGMGTLLPWNFFTTAKQYFSYKFRNTSIPDTGDYSKDMTYFQTTYENYLAVFALVPNVVFMYMNAAVTKCVKTAIRFAFGIALMLIVFALTIFFVVIDTDSFQDSFFWTTQISVVFINAGSALMQGSLFGMGSLFPSKYMGAIMKGQAIGGMSAALSNIVTLAFSSSPKDSALAYFVIAEIIMIVCLVSFFSIRQMEFVRYHTMHGPLCALNESTGEVEADSADDIYDPHYCPDEDVLLSRTHERPPLLRVAQHLAVPAFSVFLVFAVTLSLFPAVIASISSVSKESTQWTLTYFTPVVCFLLFNFSDFCGRYLASVFLWPRAHQKVLTLVLCVLRLGFVPLFIYCNYNPRSRLPVFFNHDAYPITFVTLFGLSNGYLGTLCMIHAPSLVPHGEEAAGALMSFFLTCGLASGACLSFIYPNVV